MGGRGLAFDPRPALADRWPSRGLDQWLIRVVSELGSRGVLTQNRTTMAAAHMRSYEKNAPATLRKPNIDATK